MYSDQQPSQDILSSNSSNSPHSYGTRIRHNITIKPSARLRQSPVPSRKQKHSTANNFPDFPPPHIVLHPDDANNRVFLAIARSFLSIVCIDYIYFKAIISSFL